MKALENYSKDFALLLEAGFIAINQMEEASALHLFGAAEELQPDSYLPKLGYGMIHLHKLDLNKAIKYFQQILKKEPNNETAKIFMALAYSLTKDNKAKSAKIIEETKNATDPLVKDLASTMSEFIAAHNKKASTPFEMLTKPKKTAKQG